ncbi:S-adenosyl-L-methionine-dependent methyltransferases superfamily protein [Tanacetum coccineum]
MANRFPTILLHQRLPTLAGVHPNAHFSTTLVNNNKSRYYPVRRRLVFGIGVSFLSQFTNMSGFANSIIASARTKGSVDKVLENVEWPEQFPFRDEDFQRFDESSDLVFYESPRFVTHIDDPAIAALTKYYKEVFPPSNTPGVALLDMCSSWISHFPPGYKQERIVGMGLNKEELKANKVLTEYLVQDLNVNPKLPFEDNSFDVITNVVSVDYLTKPIEVFKEMHRVLKPGGKAIMSALDISPKPAGCRVPDVHCPHANIAGIREKTRQRRENPV